MDGSNSDKNNCDTDKTDEVSIELRDEESSGCGCCQDNSVTSPLSFTCADKPDPFSKEEHLIFEKLLAIKKKVKALKDKLINASQDEKKSLLSSISNLREEWRSWKKKSQEAARRRMIILGHIDPNDE